MKKFIVTVEKEITIEFDENNAEFIEMFEGYQRFIDSGADHKSLAESIASTVSRYGVSEMIEGVGYLKHNGENQTIYHNGKYELQNGLVNVDVDTDLNRMVDFEISYTRENE